MALTVYPVICAATVNSTYREDVAKASDPWAAMTRTYTVCGLHSVSKRKSALILHAGPREWLGTIDANHSTIKRGRGAHKYDRQASATIFMAFSRTREAVRRPTATDSEPAVPLTRDDRFATLRQPDNRSRQLRVSTLGHWQIRSIGSCRPAADDQMPPSSGSRM